MKKGRSLRKNNLKNRITIWLPMSFGFIFSILFSLLTIKYSFKISHCTGLTVSWQVTVSQPLVNSWSWNAIFAIAKPSLKSNRGTTTSAFFGCYLVLDRALLSMAHFPLVLNARSDRDEEGGDHWRWSILQLWNEPSYLMSLAFVVDTHSSWILALYAHGKEEK